MPTRKQRRRRDKTFRHEYDLITYDDEGNEVTVDTAELRAAKEKDSPKKKLQSGSGAKRPTRDVSPPSWNRAVKVGGFMGAIFLLIMVAINGPIALGLLYALTLIPFTYWMDRFKYRRYLQKTGKS